ncbi:hypothetical protein COLO4_37871 [Corchorus olitorius]|uniref:Uncharacterized protein n=1 Tax=Corchorus olitorius TaxID=93759 RepID=A0A1R3FYI0_9ROSI|nr:hypothetical protein COLO4_37871 [Corchorus olitorius]
MGIEAFFSGGDSFRVRASKVHLSKIVGCKGREEGEEFLGRKEARFGKRRRRGRHPESLSSIGALFEVRRGGSGKSGPRCDFNGGG